MHQYTKRYGRERAWQLQQQTGGNVWNILIHLAKMKSPCFYTKLCKLIQFQVGIELSTKELRGEYDFQMKKIPA